MFLDGRRGSFCNPYRKQSTTAECAFVCLSAAALLTDDKLPK